MIHSILMAGNRHIGFDGLYALISSQSGYQVVGHTDQVFNLSNMLIKVKPSLLVLCYDFVTTLHCPSIAELRKTSPLIGIVIMSTKPLKNSLITELYQVGANAFFHLGSINQNDLFDAFQTVLDGNNFYEKSYLDEIIQRAIRPQELAFTNISQLTTREMQVLIQIAKGRSAKKIANTLAIKSGTVEVHRRNIMKKLNIHKSTDLTRFVHENGLID